MQKCMTAGTAGDEDNTIGELIINNVLAGAADFAVQVADLTECIDTCSISVRFPKK